MHEIRQYRTGFNTVQLAKALANQDKKEIRELFSQLRKVKSQIAEVADTMVFQDLVGPVACCCCCCSSESIGPRAQVP